MKKFKSYGCWIALSGAVVVLVNALGKCFGFSVEEQLITDIIMAIAGLLVVLGIVVLPKNSDENGDAGNEEGEVDEMIEEENQKENQVEEDEK